MLSRNLIEPDANIYLYIKRNMVRNNIPWAQCNSMYIINMYVNFMCMWSIIYFVTRCWTPKYPRSKLSKFPGMWFTNFLLVFFTFYVIERIGSKRSVTILALPITIWKQLSMMIVTHCSLQKGRIPKTISIDSNFFIQQLNLKAIWMGYVGYSDEQTISLGCPPCWFCQ